MMKPNFIWGLVIGILVTLGVFQVVVIPVIEFDHRGLVKRVEALERATFGSPSHLQPGNIVSNVNNPQQVFGKSAAKPQPTETLFDRKFSVGNPDAKWKIEEFSDFHCPYCRKSSLHIQNLLKDYGDQIYWTFRVFPLSTTPGRGSFSTSHAAFCAAEQNKFFDFYRTVFEKPGAPKPEELSSIAFSAGLDQSKFDSCMSSEKYNRHIIEAEKAGLAEGVQGTPTFKINGVFFRGVQSYEKLAGLLISGNDLPVGDAPVVRAPQRPALVEANMDDLRSGIEGRPTIGNLDAPVIISEFSDFHCPYCGRVQGPLNQIMEDYGDDVARVFRHFPLSFHKKAEGAHVASECAHQQGKFWEYKDAIFADPRSAREKEDFDRIAEEVGLDMDAFHSCYEDPATLEVVKNDIEIGRKSGATGTPTSYINNKKFVGAKSVSAFKSIIDSELES